MAAPARSRSCCPPSVGPDLASSQKFTVALPGGRSVGISGLHAQLADNTAVRKAGLAPLTQPAILVTGQLDPGAGAASVLQDAHLRTQASVVLRSESLADLLGRQFQRDAQQRDRAMRRTIPVIRQMEYADCGAACLAMVLGHFGKHVDLRELRDMTGAGRDGVTALSVVNAARAYGLRARGVQADLDDLRHLPRGSILHWEFSHFVVFERITRKGSGSSTRRTGGGSCRWMTCAAPTPASPSSASPRMTSTAAAPAAKGTWRYLRPMLRQSRNMVRVIATSLVIRLAALGLPLLTVLVVDEIVPRNDHHLLLVFTAGVGVVIGYNFLSAFLRANLLLELQTRLDMGLTMGFIDHLVKLPYGFFLRQIRRRPDDAPAEQHGGSRHPRDQHHVRRPGRRLREPVPDRCCSSSAPSWPSWCSCSRCSKSPSMVLSWRRNQRLMSRSLQAQADTQSYAYELLAGIETLKASGAEHRAVDHWGGLFTDQVNIDLTRGRLTAAVDSVMSTLQVASPLVILMVGAFQVLDGHISLGTMLSAAALGAGFLEPAGHHGCQRPAAADARQLHAAHQRCPRHPA